MRNIVDEYTDGIEQATQFSEVRDLLGLWRRAGGETIPDLAAFDSLLIGGLAERTMLLTASSDSLVYERVGRSVILLFGHDPTGKMTIEISNEGARAFWECYRRAADAGKPIFAVQHQIGLGVISAHERLILPVDTSQGRKLIVYVRPRRDNTEILRAVFNGSADGILVIGAVRDAAGDIIDFRILAANREMARRHATEPDRMIGRLLCEVVPAVRATGVLDLYAAAVGRDAPEIHQIQYETAGKAEEREMRLVPLGDGLVVTSVDLGPQRAAARAIEMQRNEVVAANLLLRRQAADLLAANRSLEEKTFELGEEIARNRTLEAELTRLAHVDRLTGLANRARFEDAVERALRSGRRAALCIFDLDHFKDINDSLGHSAGDIVLQETAARLTRAACGTGPVGRLGGDEFAVLLTDPADLADVGHRAAKLIEAVAKPFAIAHQDIPMSVSVGIAMFPADGGSRADLFSHADIALYRAKRAGRGRAVLFERRMRASVDRRFKLLKRFRQALEEGEIAAHYQPVVALASHRLIGFEALARWHHPQRGVLLPAEFLDALQEPGLANGLCSTMIDRVTADFGRWGRKGLTIGINTTAFDLRQPDFAADLLTRLAARGMPSQQIVIEVTEGVMLSRDAGRIAATIDELRRQGVRVALDDFGTGYASLSQLRNMAVDLLKIDRSFIRDFGTDDKAAAIVTTIVALATMIGLTCVVEGIETRAQLDFVRSLRCDAIQGELVARPMPADQVGDFIADFDSGAAGPRGCEPVTMPAA